MRCRVELGRVRLRHISSVVWVLTVSKYIDIRLNQQTPSDEYDSEEGEDDELPDVDLGKEEEEDKGVERDTSLPVPDTPLLSE
jgi:hypothetical protein